MNTTLTIKMDKKLRDDAKKTAHEMGIPLTTVINAMTRQFVRDRVIVLEADCPFPSHTPNAKTRKALLEGMDPKNQAKMKTYSNTEEMFADILGKNWRTKAIKA